MDQWTAAAVLFIGAPMIVLGILGWQKAIARIGKQRAQLAARWPTKDEAPLFDQVFGAKITCPHCERPVSATATTCPKCGARVEPESSFQNDLSQAREELPLPFYCRFQALFRYFRRRIVLA